MSKPQKFALGVALGALALFLALRAAPRPSAPPERASAGVAALPAATPGPAPAAPPTPAPAAVVAPPPVIAAPPVAARPPKPPTARRPEEPTADPFVAAVVGTTPEAARLNVEYARAHLPVPPEARTLIEMRQRGAPTDQLVAYVRTSFPKGILVRGIALRWLGVGAERAEQVRLHGGTDPASTLVPARAD